MECVTAHRQLPDVRIGRGSNQSRVGTRLPATPFPYLGRHAGLDVVQALHRDPLLLDSIRRRPICGPTIEGMQHRLYPVAARG